MSSSPSAPTETGESAEPYVYVFFAPSSDDASDTADAGAEADAERRDAIVESLARLGIPLSPDDVFDADLTDFDDQERERLGSAAAVLIFWSRYADEDVTLTAAYLALGRTVIAELDQVAPPFSQLPQPPWLADRFWVTATVDMAGWTGDANDPLLHRLADALRKAVDQQPAGLSENAHQVLARSSARLVERAGWSPASEQGVPSPTDVLIEVLSYRPPEGGGVGTDLLRALAQRQVIGASGLLWQAAGELNEPQPQSIATGPSLDALLALARRCALKVSGHPEIHLRHLLAAAVPSDSPPLNDGVLDRLGTSALELPGLLLEVLRRARIGDSIEAWERLLAVRLAGGYDPDLVDPGEAIPRDRDDLGYRVWAAMFASVIADPSTAMPMSIGLFGEWGAGKSTFMGLLRGEIRTLCGRPGYVQDVVSIGFNAWHYADASLWASLGDEIFRAGRRAQAGRGAGPVGSRAGGGPADQDHRPTRPRQGRAGPPATGGAAATVAAERLAAQQRAARERRRVSAKGLIAALFTSAQVRSAAQQEADRAWRLLGISDDVEQGEMLAGQIDGISQDGRALRSLVGWPMTWALAGAVALLLAILNLDAHIFAQVTDAPARPEAGVTGGLAGATAELARWESFAAGLIPEPAAGPDGTTRCTNRVIGEIPAADLPAWQRIAGAVQATTHLVTLPDLEPFRAWTPHVRRFSYYLLLTPAP